MYGVQYRVSLEDRKAVSWHLYGLNTVRAPILLDGHRASTVPYCKNRAGISRLYSIIHVSVLPRQVFGQGAGDGDALASQAAHHRGAPSELARLCTIQHRFLDLHMVYKVQVQEHFSRSEKLLQSSPSPGGEEHSKKAKPSARSFIKRQQFLASNCFVLLLLMLFAYAFCFQLSAFSFQLFIPRQEKFVFVFSPHVFALLDKS